MHAVYYNKLKILFSELTQPQLDRHQRSQHSWKMTISFTALSGSRFWSRRVLLKGPKLQNTDCTDMFSTAVTGHDKQQTSGHLRTANNNDSEMFFQIRGKCFISSIMSKFWWHTFYRQHKPPKPPSSPEERIFPLIFIATIRQIFCLSPLMLMRIWCQFFPSWIPFEHSNFSLRLQPHSPIKPAWSDLRDLTFDCIQFNDFRS